LTRPTITSYQVTYDANSQCGTCAGVTVEYDDNPSFASLANTSANCAAGLRTWPLNTTNPVFVRLKRNCTGPTASSTYSDT
jgi:hypothetical protein